MKINKKRQKQIKAICICIIVVLVIWFVILSPILKFKKDEKTVEDAAKRYYEINNGQLPTGKKIKTVSLQTLYEKKFIEEDIRASYTNKVCDSKSSWVKVKQQDNDYKYYVYLDCGLLKSKVDHSGPQIKLKGQDEVTVNKGETYKDPGIDSVTDDTDGKMDISKVEINDKKLDTSKIGTYEISYKIKDSFNNETIKIRTVKVIETLNHIVEKDTKGSKVYKGTQDSNYVKLDGILFKIVGENEDGTIKLVSSTNLAAVDYDGVQEWLNDYFYDKLSDSAKKLIQKSKWCNEKVTDADQYTTCNQYSKKTNVGLLSIADINNSKAEDGTSNIDTGNVLWLANANDSKTNWSIDYDKYVAEKTSSNIPVSPVINIIKDTIVTKGNGTAYNPYILKGNKKTLKAGEKISEARVGEYISYSGYSWRIISKAKDETTQIIMTDVTEDGNGNYYVNFDEGTTLSYNPSKKNNIGYYITNDVVGYVKTSLFQKKKIEIADYTKTIGYQKDSKKNSYNIKMTIPSMYDLFSANTTATDYWYRDYSSSNSTCCHTYYGKAVCEKYDYDMISGIKIVAYLKKNVQVKSGEGEENNPYKIAG